MSQFLTHLHIEDDFGLPFELIAPLVYSSDVLNRVVTVPVKFKTDLASIPIGLWNLLPKSGLYDRAAVVHDYLYQFNGCTRGDADGVLNEAMGVLGVGWFRRKMIYLGVRTGGWHSWNHYRGQGVDQ